MIAPETTEQNQLALIVRESGLESTKANIILTKFQDYFAMAAEWEIKAKNIVVTKETQEAEMEMAKTGRLFLRKKRIDIENSRKELKEQALREGKAIDGIANVLKALIVPIEEYLEKQEKFVEIQADLKREAMRIEIEKKIEEERIAKEKAEAEERERIRLENERLKKEAEEKELALQKEREEVAKKQREAEAKAKAEQDKIKKEAEAKQAALRKEAEEKEKALRAEQEAKLAKERAEREKLEAEMKAKKEAEEKERREAQEKEEAMKSASDQEKLAKAWLDINAIEFLEVESEKSKAIIQKVKELLKQAQDLLEVK